PRRCRPRAARTAAVLRRRCVHRDGGRGTRTYSLPEPVKAPRSRRAHGSVAGRTDSVLIVPPAPTGRTAGTSEGAGRVPSGVHAAGHSDHIPGPRKGGPKRLAAPRSVGGEPGHTASRNR